ncbi:hypothetical protein G4B88_012548 [Cannabis sativa]|uniref:MIR domain-containing protein n=1 Tax=Cannabis sativa TaxID=3483 RepID=A0A7J6ERL8_CANSA|nr:hypothetical protein G4B88_012548 [Cannabis sativa]
MEIKIKYLQIDQKLANIIVRPVVEAKTSAKQGDSIRSGSVIRLQHMRTRKWLHSHLHASPITGNQEEGNMAGNHDIAGIKQPKNFDIVVLRKEDNGSNTETRNEEWQT